MAETLPNIPIAFAPSMSEEPRVRRVKFGDGYEMRVGDGLNLISQTTTVPWENRTYPEMAILIDFFRRHTGQYWFWWHPPGDVIGRKLICSKWSYTRATNSSYTDARYNISAEFYQVHDLG